MTIAAARRIERRADQGVLPLSFAQQRIWFVEQLQPGLGLYNEHGALRLIGALDLDALERSVQQIVARHEILRTVFPVVDDRPVQVVLPAATAPLARLDLRSLSEDARDESLRRLADEHAHTPFDVVRGPLLRLSAVRLEDDEQVLLVTMHHLVADGWSFWVLTRELAAIYEATHAGRASPLPDLPVQYGDYAIWQRASLDDSTVAEHLAYWQAQLRDAPPTLDLPVDAPATAVRTYRGAFRSVRLSPSLSGRLTDLSRRLRTTSFATMLAGLHILLQRWTGQTDQVVSVPIVERPDVALEGLVGCFLNVLLVRTDLSGTPTASQLIRQVHDTVAAAYGRQDLPFDHLVRALTRDRQAAHAPFSDVLVNFESFPQRALTLPGVTIRKAEYAEPPARFPITIYVDDDGNGLSIRALYQAELFTGARIAALLDEYQHVLGCVADDPERPIDAYSLVTPRTIGLIPDPAAPLPMPATSSIVDMIREHAAATPDHDAVRWNGRMWSYGRLVADAERIATALRRTLGAGDVVAVAGGPGYGAVAAMLGSLASGCIVLPLDRQLPVRRQREMLTLANGRAIVAVGEAGAHRAESLISYPGLVYLRRSGCLRAPFLPGVCCAILPE
jgi:non-ribosomal peptide synthetase component F